MLTDNIITLIFVGILFLVIGFLFQIKYLDWGISITGFNSAKLRGHKNGSKIRITKAISLYLAGICLIFGGILNHFQCFIILALSILICADLVMLIIKKR